MLPSFVSDSFLVPFCQFFWIFQTQNRFDNRDNKKFQNQTFSEQSEELWERFWQIQIGEGQVESFQNVLEHVKVVLDGILADFL